MVYANLPNLADATRARVDLEVDRVMKDLRAKTEAALKTHERKFDRVRSSLVAISSFNT